MNGTYIDIIKVGKFITVLRQERKLSQRQLAEKLNVTRQAISKWENGLRLPSPEILIVLSEFFEVSINEILKGKRV